MKHIYLLTLRIYYLEKHFVLHAQNKPNARNEHPVLGHA